MLLLFKKYFERRKFLIELEHNSKMAEINKQHELAIKKIDEQYKPAMEAIELLRSFLSGHNRGGHEESKQ
jgi:hypothetical protein